MKEMTGSVEKGCFANDLIAKVKEMVRKDRQHLASITVVSLLTLYSRGVAIAWVWDWTAWGVIK